MKSVIPYLFFNGQCAEALAFYKACFDGELTLLTYGDVPSEVTSTQFASPSGRSHEILHGVLCSDFFCLMASDWPQGAAQLGNNIQLSIECDTLAELEELARRLGEQGTVIRPISDMFWGARFGMLVDRFGVHWMLNCVLPGASQFIPKAD